MQEFLANLTTSQQIYWGCTLGAGAVFIIQNIMMLIGIGGDSADFDGVDADTGLSEGGIGTELMDMFSFRNLINFLLGFGVAGIAFEPYIENALLLALVAVAFGLLLVGCFIFVMNRMKKLENDGNIDIERDVVGKEADVYLVIHAGGRGKVQVSVNGSVREYDAINVNPNESLPTGARVRIVGTTGADGVKVEKI